MADRDPGQDSLFREVDEELRQEQFMKLWKKYGNYAIAVAVLAIAGVAGYQFWHARNIEQRAAESAIFTSALRSAVANEAAKATAELTTLAETGTPGYALMAKFDLAGIAARAGDKATAARTYLNIANDSSVAQELRDLALVLSVTHELDSGDPKTLNDRIAPLAQSANPWRFNAKELSALLARRMGENDRAATLFRELADDATAPSGIRARAAELSAVLGS